MNRRREILWWMSGVLAGVVALVLSARFARAEEDKMKVYRLAEKDLVEFKTDDGGLKVARYIQTPDIRVGFARFEKGTNTVALRNWPYWYGEVVYVTRGKGKITHSAPPFTSSEPHEVQPGDLFHISKGSKVTFEALSDEPFEILYVAYPNPEIE